jgi:hypothetical protein
MPEQDPILLEVEDLELVGASVIAGGDDDDDDDSSSSFI